MLTPAVELILSDVMVISTGAPSFSQVIEGEGIAKDSQENETLSPTILVLLTSGCCKKVGVTRKH